MRQGQQNRRGRGRSGNNSSNGNRKTQNPLSRTYESNGPDVKIRGTAAQIAEKYSTLSRDASSSGDRVMAENYLQHAEHYNRIIMAAQVANVQNAANNIADAGYGMNGSQRPQREPGQNLRDQPQPHVSSHPGSEPQPVIANPEQPEAKVEPVAKLEATEAQPSAETDGGSEDEKAARSSDQSEQPRRRRRRYPSASGNGTSRASTSGSENGGVAERTASAVSEAQSSDEATA